MKEGLEPTCEESAGTETRSLLALNVADRHWASTGTRGREREWGRCCELGRVTRGPSLSYRRPKHLHAEPLGGLRRLQPRFDKTAWRDVHYRAMTVFERVGRGVILGFPAWGAALTTLGAWRLARRLVAPRSVGLKFFTPWELGMPYEDVEFTTSDGLTLSGWWLEAPDATRTVVALTGHYGGRSDTLGIGAALWRKGMNVLLFDFRGRGTSEPHINTLGYYETLDALAAAAFARRKAPGSAVGFVGYSMGGAVAIMAAARDEHVGAVVADSPFASQRQVLRRHFSKRTRLPAFPFLPLTALFLPYDMDAVEPIQEVAKIAPRALMLIHGDRDPITDPRDSDALFAAAGEPKEMWALPGAGHCDAYFLDRTAYVERVAAFFEQHLRPEEISALAGSTHV